MNFDSMLEQDVREDIITPLLHRLGYEKGSENDIKREHYLVLRYEREYLGRKKPSTDPQLTGKADYILEVQGKVRWVIEAKPPVSPITLDDIEQAYSYAKHPEVRAALFCICNGHELQIFRSDRTPDSALIAKFTYDEFETRYQEIENILSPASILRNWPEIEIDTGVPLGPGLKSTAQVTGGFYRYTSSQPRNAIVEDMHFTVTGGVVLRENGKLSGTITTQSPFESAQRLSEKVGTHIIEFTSSDTHVSTDPSRPTILVSSSSFSFPKGAVVMGYRFPVTVDFSSTTIVQGYLDGNVFKGTLSLDMKSPVPNSSSRTRGEFEVHLS